MDDYIALLYTKARETIRFLTGMVENTLPDS